ncbi:phospholipase, partial [Escherichia coli]|nr:phospholipase [Escherichia coli]
MRYIRSLLAVALFYPAWGFASEIPASSPAPLVQGSIISGLLQEYDSPFVLYPYESNYIIYTKTSDMNKEAIQSYDWGNKAKKDEVKF